MPVTINGTTGIAGPDGSASTPAVQGTDSNTGLFYPAADTVALSTGGTERMRIDSSGNVGIGVTPSVWTSFKALEVTGGAIGGITTNQFDVVQNAYYNSSFKYKTTGAASLYQQAGTGHGFYSAASGSADASISWTQVLVLDKDKSVALQGASTQVGIGITFPPTQSASSDANTLDDYEEGTWTPGVAFGGSSTGVTYSANNGVYTKVGRMVYCQLILTLTNNGSSTGSAYITGLPFTVADILSGTSVEGGGAILEFSNAGASVSGFNLEPISGGTTAAIIKLPAGGTSSSVAADTDITDTFNCRAYFIYPA